MLSAIKQNHKTTTRSPTTADLLIPIDTQLPKLIRQLIRSIDLRLNSLIRGRITFPALIVPIQPLPNHPTIISPLTADPHRTAKSALHSPLTRQPIPNIIPTPSATLKQIFAIEPNHYFTLICLYTYELLISFGVTIPPGRLQRIRIYA
jgi:hypothetical protein